MSFYAFLILILELQTQQLFWAVMSSGLLELLETSDTIQFLNCKLSPKEKKQITLSKWQNK